MGQSLTEASNPESVNLSELPISGIVALMNRLDEGVIVAVREALPSISALAEAVYGSLAQSHRLFYIGAGTSGRLGVLDASECPPTFGVDPGLVQAIMAGGLTAITRAVENAEDDREAGAKALRERGMQPGDAVIGISASGTTPFVLGALEYARSQGAVTGSVYCNPGAPAGEVAQYPVLVAVGPEVLRGSTRLKAGTATKMVLNMISTAVMVKMGHCLGNLMIDVVANNRKLVDRQARILAELKGLEYDTARLLLVASGGNMRQVLKKLEDEELAALATAGDGANEAPRSAASNQPIN